MSQGCDVRASIMNAHKVTSTDVSNETESEDRGRGGFHTICNPIKRSPTITSMRRRHQADDNQLFVAWEGSNKGQACPLQYTSTCKTWSWKYHICGVAYDDLDMLWLTSKAGLGCNLLVNFWVMCNIFLFFWNVQLLAGSQGPHRDPASNPGPQFPRGQDPLEHWGPIGVPMPPGRGHGVSACCWKNNILR